MLNKAHRLTSNFEFNITRKYGKKIITDSLVTYYLIPNNYNGPAKIGIVVSNSIHKSAARRNRVKRLIRESIRLKLKEIEEKKLWNKWIVVQAKKPILDSSYEKICTEISEIIQKIFVAN